MHAEQAQGIHNDSKTYRMLLQGTLTSHTFHWLDDINITLNEHGEILLVTMVIDRAALRGLLDQFSSVSLTILPTEGIGMDQYSGSNQVELDGEHPWISPDDALIESAQLNS